MLNTIANKLATDGWASLEGHVDADLVAELKAKGERVMLDKAQPYAELFSTPLGQKVLTDLIEMTLLRSWTDAELFPVSSELYAIEKAKRQGQNSIVITIMSMIMTARKINEGKVS